MFCSDYVLSDGWKTDRKNYVENLPPGRSVSMTSFDARTAETGMTPPDNA
jgi:hypothetical protein